jgi:hypothetical protein
MDEMTAQHSGETFHAGAVCGKPATGAGADVA